MNLIWAAVAAIKSSVTRVEDVVFSAELMELDVIIVSKEAILDVDVHSATEVLSQPT